MARRKPGIEPRGGEFSHGRGLMPPEEMGHVPTAPQFLAAIRRTDPADPTVKANYKGIGDKPGTTPPVREGKRGRK